MNLQNSYEKLEGNGTFLHENGNNCQPRILYLTKKYFMNEGKTEILK